MNGERIKLGVSSCLLGEKVRYDGRDKFNALIVNELETDYRLISICPEMAIGLGVPRPPIRLQGVLQAPRAIGRDDPSIDVTEALVDYGRKLASKLEDVGGFILKSRSPSCGVANTEILLPDGTMETGDGLFALTLKQRIPKLPITDEITLSIPEKRRAFLEQVEHYSRK